ncbi:MAG: hypothetical protein E3J83_06315 [Candidatus Atribacteria bacterium]|nr:MAG: hypothetical protein E3J83_06315 [Candidatus Atribacteria bacterium]
MKVFKNIINSLDELKNKKLSFIVKSNEEVLELLRAIELIFKDKQFEMFSIYHCPCGNIFVYPNKEFEELKFDFKADNKNNLLCPACGDYKIDVGLTFHPKGDLKIMLDELDYLFDKAKNDNKFSYYMFISNTFFESDKLFDEIFKSVDSYLYITDDLELKVRLGKIGKFELEEGIDYEKTILRLRFLIYCHIIELKKIYNLLNNLIKIAYCEIAAINKEKRQISPIRFDFYNDSWVIGDIIENIVRVTNKKGLSLGNFIKSFYSNELRNAFYHSQYIINDENDLLLTAYKKLIKKTDLETLFSHCFNFFRHFTENISKGKRELIKAKEISENGYKIVPIRKGDKISFKFVL